MVEQLSGGKTHREVAAPFHTSPSTTHAIFKGWKNEQTLEIKPRSGRPSKLTKSENKYIILLTKRNRKITYAALVGAMGGRVSKTMIRRAINDKWRRKWKGMNRIPIARECAKKRLAFTRGWISDADGLMEVRTIEAGVSVEAISRLTGIQVMFSDECSVQSQRNKGVEWLFRSPHEKYYKAFVNVTVHGKAPITLMLWACIWRDGRSDLVVMERDPDSARNGFTARSYPNALSEGLLPVSDGTRRFQQDNARIHNFGGTPEWLQLHGIEFVDWPPRSPDINPIEHVGKALKEILVNKYPQIRDLKNNEADRAKLAEYLRLAWGGDGSGVYPEAN